MVVTLIFMQIKKIAMSKVFVVNHFNYNQGAKFRNPVFEKFSKPSLTVPGMVMSLAEMLKRYVRGENVTVFEPVYTDLDIPDNLELMGEIERLDMARNLDAGIRQHRSKMTKAKDVPLPDKPAEPVDPVL